MNQQRGRSRKQQVPHRAPMDSGTIVKPKYQKPVKQPIKRRRLTSRSDSPTPELKTTPPPSVHNSPPVSPDTSALDTMISNSAPAEASSDMDFCMANHNLISVSDQDDHRAAAAAGYDSLGVTAAATAATTGMLSVMQGPTAAPSGAKKRKKPTTDQAAGSSKPCNKRGKGQATTGKAKDLVPGLCDFCGETMAPLWRKGSEQYKRLCNRCGIRYNRSKHPETFFSDKELQKALEWRRSHPHGMNDDQEPPFCCINNKAQFGNDHLDNHNSPAINHTAAAAGTNASPVFNILTIEHSWQSTQSLPANLLAGLEHKTEAAAKRQRGRPKAVHKAASSGFEAAVPASSCGAAAGPRATRTRRATEKGAALQQTQLVKRGRGRPRKPAAEDSDCGTLEELIAQALRDSHEESGALEAADQPDEASGYDYDADSGEGDEGDRDHDGTYEGRGHRAREGVSGIEALLMVVEADLDAMDVMDSAGGDMPEDSSGMSRQMSDAPDDGQDDAQVVPRATNTAAGGGGSGMVARRFSYVESLKSDEQLVPQPQSTQGVQQQQQVGMASNLQVAPLAVAHLQAGWIGLMNQQAQLQQQLVLMQQPAALQMLLQQPALLGPAGILLQGQMMHTGLIPAMQLRRAATPAASAATPPGPGNAHIASCAMPPMPAAPVAGSRVVLPHAEPLRLAQVHAAAAPNVPTMQHLLQPHQLQQLRDFASLVQILAPTSRGGNGAAGAGS